MEEKKCNVCGTIEDKGAIEVFGIIYGQERGCSACIGITHFPDREEFARLCKEAEGK